MGILRLASPTETIHRKLNPIYQFHYFQSIYSSVESRGSVVELVNINEWVTILFSLCWKFVALCAFSPRQRLLCLIKTRNLELNISHKLGQWHITGKEIWSSACCEFALGLALFQEHSDNGNRWFEKTSALFLPPLLICKHSLIGNRCERIHSLERIPKLNTACGCYLFIFLEKNVTLNRFSGQEKTPPHFHYQVQGVTSLFPSPLFLRGKRKRGREERTSHLVMEKYFIPFTSPTHCKKKTNNFWIPSE